QGTRERSTWMAAWPSTAAVPERSPQRATGTGVADSRAAVGLTEEGARLLAIAEAVAAKMLAVVRGAVGALARERRAVAIRITMRSARTLDGAAVHGQAGTRARLCGARAAAARGARRGGEREEERRVFEVR